ncbi:TniQ family protein [Roseovarius aestuariivivens]|uniref:TniQ family protein n=1 Tax=Roseovarius aestuariivivens TaxID=1888910 RepID=UPI001080923C|nr:TniQ family protein [Roseovarius aestuariivivens]
MRLPVPTPAKQESLDGFLRRLAEAEFWPDVSDYLSGFGLRYGRRLIEEAGEVEERLGLEKGTLAKISPSVAPSEPSRNWRFERYHSAPVCPACVAAGAPHHQSWRHDFVTCCVEHGLRLVDQCPMCQGTLLPGRGGYDSCHCGCPLDRLERTEVDDVEIAISALIAGKMHPARSRLAPAMAFRTPSDIGEFIFFLASGGVETVTGKQGKTPLPRSLEETRGFLLEASRLICDWPYAFRDEVVRRLRKGDTRASSAPAQLGRWYQRLMSFEGDAYADFREALSDVVRQEFDGMYVGGIQIASDERDWISAAEAARQLHIRSDRLVGAVGRGQVPGRQKTSGFGHRHTMLHKTILEEIRANRSRFVEKAKVREFLGISRKQYDILEEAGGFAACLPESVPPLVDGSHDLDALRRFVQSIAKRAVEPEGDTVALSDLNLRFTTDRTGLIEVIRNIISHDLRPATGTTDGLFSTFRFARAAIDAILTDVRRGPGLTVQQVAELTGWKGQCISQWCQQGLLKHRYFDHAGGVGRVIAHEDLMDFQAKFVPVASLARQINTSPRFLIARLQDAGVQTAGAFQDGAAWRGHLVPTGVLAEHLITVTKNRSN